MEDNGKIWVNVDPNPVLGKLLGLAMMEPVQKKAVAVVPAAVSSTDGSKSGEIFTDEDSDKFTAQTVSGLMQVVRNSEQVRRILLDGKVLLNGEMADYQYPVRKFDLSPTKQVVLMENSGGRGTSCETTMFLVLLEAGKAPTFSAEFGSCFRGGTYKYSGSNLELSVPKIGGNDRFVFDGITLSENGKMLVVGTDNDPTK